MNDNTALQLVGLPTTKAILPEAPKNWNASKFGNNEWGSETI